MSLSFFLENHPVFHSYDGDVLLDRGIILGKVEGGEG